ncbi:MAG: amino acid ABC transporter permease, partial [Deferrisomatales bacterium]
MAGFVKTERHPDLKPPLATVGALGWLRANLFDGWWNALLTLGVLAAASQVFPPLVRWALIDAVWTAGPE